MVAPLVAYATGAALGAAGGVVTERILNPGATQAEYFAAGAVGAIPGAGLSLKGGVIGMKQLNRFRKLVQKGRIPNAVTGLAVLSSKGTRFPFASGRPLFQPIIMGGAVSYIATTAYGNLTQSSGGEQVIKRRGTPITRKTMRGRSAKTRNGKSSRYFRRDEERYRGRR